MPGNWYERFRTSTRGGLFVTAPPHKTYQATMYPNLLQPNSTEDFVISGKTIKIPKCIIQFKKWNGVGLKETFGGKSVIDMNGKPMFAELAIMNLFIQSGWKAVWVETYARLKKDPFYMSVWDFEKTYKNQTHSLLLEKEMSEMLAKISEIKGSYSGCWDVLGWNNKQIIFAESKRMKKDSIRQTQIGWLEAGLKYGLHLENFMVVQWDF